MQEVFRTHLENGFEGGHERISSQGRRRRPDVDNLFLASLILMLKLKTVVI